MAKVLRVIDIGDAPELVQFVEESIASGEPVVLRRAGRDLAVLEPLDGAGPTGIRRELTAEEEEAFRSGAGAWRDLPDADELERYIKSLRGRPGSVDEE
jgi:hypothetical protein